MRKFIQTIPAVVLSLVALRLAAAAELESPRTSQETTNTRAMRINSGSLEHSLDLLGLNVEQRLRVLDLAKSVHVDAPDIPVARALWVMRGYSGTNKPREEWIGHVFLAPHGDAVEAAAAPEVRMGALNLANPSLHEVSIQSQEIARALHEQIVRNDPVGEAKVLSQIFGKGIVLTDVVSLDLEDQDEGDQGGEPVRQTAKRVGSILERPIEMLVLDEHYEAMIKAEYGERLTVRQLAAKTMAELRKNPGVGPRCATALQAALRTNGLRLGMTEEDFALYDRPLIDLEFAGKNAGAVKRFLGILKSNDITTIGQLVNIDQRELYLRIRPSEAEDKTGAGKSDMIAAFNEMRGVLQNLKIFWRFARDLRQAMDEKINDVMLPAPVIAKLVKAKVKSPRQLASKTDVEMVQMGLTISDLAEVKAFLLAISQH